MPKFRIRSTSTEPSNIEASDWSGAITKLMGRMTGSGSTVNVTLGEGGATEVWEDGREERFIIDTDDGIPSAFELSDVPTTDLWDAPIPGSGARDARKPDDNEVALISKSVSALREMPSDTDACEQALNLLLTHIPAESGSVLLAEGSHLRFTSVRGPHADALIGKTIPIDQGIAGAVATSGRSLLVQEARTNPHHNATVDQKINHITRTILAVPIQTQELTLGVLELLNPFGSDTFLPWHKALSRDVAAALAARF